MLVELRSGRVITTTPDNIEKIREVEKIIAIYKRNKLDFKRVWTKPNPKLYTLKLPNNYKRNVYYQHKFDDVNHYRFDKLRVGDTWKCYFTLEEIADLPNQPLIKSLFDEEIEQ